MEFAKLCPSGSGRGTKGEDLNECNVMPGVCDGGECVNTDGSFRCECPMGYVLDESGHKCVGTFFYFYIEVAVLVVVRVGHGNFFFCTVSAVAVHFAVHFKKKYALFSRVFLH